MSIEHAGRAADSIGPIDPIDAGSGPIVVVTAIALSRSARAALAERLGPGHVVVDIRDADSGADIVLIPSVSGQLVGALRRSFPDAQILITEFTDVDFGAEFAGPVARSIESGVDGYFVVPTMDNLAAVTHHASRRGSSVSALTDGRANVPRDLMHQLGEGPDRPAGLRIDLNEWAEEVGIDTVTLMKVAEPLLSQLRRQRVDVTISGLDDNAWPPRAKNTST